MRTRALPRALVRSLATAGLATVVLGIAVLPATAVPTGQAGAYAPSRTAAEEVPDAGSPGQGEPATRDFDESPGTYESGEPAAAAGKDLLRGTEGSAATSSTAARATINRSRVLERARSWVGKGLTYSWTGTQDGYRRDCSGYVSMAWGLARPGLTTDTFAARGVTYTITKDELRPGDALNNDRTLANGHIVLFSGWTDATRSSYWGYEFTGSGVHYRKIPYPYFNNQSSYRPVRNRYVVDDPAPAPTPVNGDLYALTPDKSAVTVWNGSSWTRIGGAAGAIHAGGAGLFATNPATGDIYRYNGTPDSWTKVGNPGAAFAVSGDRLYALTPDRQAVMQWTGTGENWIQIGGAASAIHAGGAGLFATDPHTGVINRYNGTPGSWSKVGNPGAAFAVSGDRLYALTPDRQAVMQWTGTGENWIQIGGPAAAIYAGGMGLVATDPYDGDVYRFLNTPGAWTQVGGPGANFVLSGTHLYGLAPNRSVVTVWTGSGWNQIGGAAATIASGR
ncbi:hypothetical protein DEJ50_32550 [Streptomyces venezuelae]|uniref:NlpC/P60 domain-containing protein n=1 Tax=Streptomyces venezuelae TaxID=54571 RepID=A0A5P2DCP2_STRVZ|nr:hypothetical protein [Streptomyces venezuelae]QES51878.1 hypothetical protein DEJ50_32550 [Streptomyces venezuelae]